MFEEKDIIWSNIINNNTENNRFILIFKQFLINFLILRADRAEEGFSLIKIS